MIGSSFERKYLNLLSGFIDPFLVPLDVQGDIWNAYCFANYYGVLHITWSVSDWKCRFWLV